MDGGLGRAAEALEGGGGGLRAGLGRQTVLRGGCGGRAEQFMDDTDMPIIDETIRAGQAIERRELFHAILTAIEDEQIERETQ
jgi:hypothetical protein